MLVWKFCVIIQNFSSCPLLRSVSLIQWHVALFLSINIKHTATKDTDS